MAKLAIAAGGTSQTIDIFIQDTGASTGAGLTGLVFNTSSLTCYYNFPRGASTVVSLVTLASPTAAWSSGGFKEIDAVNQPGKYRFDIPNAVIASGNGRYVGLTFRGAANMAELPLEIELTGWDNQDAVRGGITALPNAAAEATGGLYTRGTGAGQINQPANGQIDANTVKVSGTVQTARDLGASVLLSPGTGTGQIALTSGAVTVGTNNDKTGYTASTVSDKTGYSLTQAFPTNFALLAIDGSGDVTASGVTVTGTVDVGKWLGTAVTAATAGVPDVNVKNWDNQAALVDANNLPKTDVTDWNAVVVGALQSFPANFSSLAISGGGAVTVGTNNDKTGYALSTAQSPILETGTAQAGAASTITLRSGASATDNLYKGLMLRIYGGTGVGQARAITGYVGSTKVATVDNAWAVNPDATSTYAIIGSESEVGAFPANFSLLGIDATGSVKIQIPLKRNIAQAAFLFTMRDTNGNLASGLTITPTVTIDGAAFIPCVNPVTAHPSGGGAYLIDLAAADLDGTSIGLRFSAAGAATKDIEILTLP